MGWTRLPRYLPVCMAAAIFSCNDTATEPIMKSGAALEAASSGPPASAAAAKPFQLQIIEDRLAPEKFAQEVALRKFDIDYGRFTQGYPLFLVGEKHIIDSQRKEMQAILRDAGATVLALEVLPSSGQDCLDDFLAGKNDGSKLRSYIQFFSGPHTESYMELIEYAREKGIRIIGLEAPCYGTLEAPKTASTPDNFSPRNKHWNGVLQSSLRENPGAKIAALMGRSHLAFMGPYPRIDISETSESKSRRWKADKPPELVWKYEDIRLKLHWYQETSGSDGFAVFDGSQIIVIKGNGLSQAPPPSKTKQPQ
jgi:hypothetical protein